MKRSEQERLLREILGEEDGENFRSASLARGVALLQQHKRRQRMAQACVAVVLPGLVIFAAVFHYTFKPTPAPPVVSPVAATRTDKAKVKFITDEELFALFPNRAVALIGSPGHQQLVFLDHGGASEQP